MASISCCGSNGLPMKACAPRSSAVAASSILPLNMMTGIAPTPCRSRTRWSISQPSTSGIITSRRIRSGGSSLQGGEPLFRAPGLTDDEAVQLEVGPHELSEGFVIVDDEHAVDRLGGRTPRFGQKRVEVVAAEPPVPPGGVESRQAAAVGPFPDRALRDAEVASPPDPA